MSTGFFISGIRVTGKDKPVAELYLDAGANLICGSSDTGKSYLYQVISYVLGRSSSPKDIDEAIGYDNFFIEIKTFAEGKTYTLFRKKRSNDISVKETSLKTLYSFPGEPLRLHAKNSTKKEKTISHFLLGFSGLQNRRVLKNKTDGITQNFTFSNFIEYFFVSETNIIKEGSPFYPSNRPTSRTVEQSVLKLLLSGKDFSTVEDVSKLKNYKASLGSKVEFISSRIIDFYKLREDAVKEKYELYSPGKEKQFADLSIDLNSVLSLLREATDERRAIFTKVNILDAQITSFEVLLDRFEILIVQYRSDLERLLFIDEAEHLSAQLGNSYCPICGSELDADHISHMEELEDFNEALKVEISKINIKINDLEGVISLRKSTLEGLEIQRAELKNSDELLRIRIVNEINPRIASIRGSMEDILQLAKVDNNIAFINEELVKLQDQKDTYLEIIKDRKERPDDETIVPQYILSDLEIYIENRLKEWKYKKSPRVTIDSNQRRFDVVISGTPRRSSGKGIRALTYTACLLGVFDCCISNEMNFPGPIVLDSPLTAFKGKGEVLKEIVSENDGLELTVKDHFFKDIAKTSKENQIIIFDNVIPPKEYWGGLNAQIFTGTDDVGRKGFFPAPAVDPVKENT